MAGERQDELKIVVAPDKFAGTLSAAAAAGAIEQGWRWQRPDDVVVRSPMSDGGPGFCAVLAAAFPEAQLLTGTVPDPLGRPVEAAVLVNGETAYVESAQAVGLHLLSPGERDPERASSAGLADLLTLAARPGISTIVIGLGGSATCDGGRGFLQALDAEHGVLRAGRSGPALSGVRLVIASDVANALLGPQGACRVFAPQKGADAAAVDRLERRMQAWVTQVPGLAALADHPGAGAAGGLGAALLWLGARYERGAERVAAAVGLPQSLADAALVVTGEGAYDATSLRGKVVGAVASAAAEAAVPCYVLAGQVAVGRREAAAHGVADAVALAELAGGAQAALAEPGRWLAEAARRLAARWQRG